MRDAIVLSTSLTIACAPSQSPFFTSHNARCMASFGGSSELTSSLNVIVDQYFASQRAFTQAGRIWGHVGIAIGGSLRMQSAA